tara:strand:- start:233 stop:805 length:573 start_codon:yes stop_codon:yes gene_type:complete
MVPVIGDDESPILPIWRAGSEFRNPNSVWNKRMVLPRIYITGGERMGLGFTRFAINTATLTGERFLEGEKTESSTPNRMASNTFGFVDDPELEIKGRPNDLSISINELIGNRLSGVKLDENGQPLNIDASTIIILAAFTPKGAELMPPLSFIPETAVKNRKPNIKRVRNKETGEMEFDSMYWTTTKRRRK